jgi:hypothetical protein
MFFEMGRNFDVLEFRGCRPELSVGADPTLDEIQPWGNANYDFEARETAGDPPERGVMI